MDRAKCVTGATGFIGGHLTERLLARRHAVRGTVRNIGSTDAVFLRGLPHAEERLELVEADLLEPGSFDEAVMGCETVFHVASPFVFTASDPAEDLLAPAVDGTLNVLEACLASPAVKRVVFVHRRSCRLARRWPDHREGLEHILPPRQQPVLLRQDPSRAGCVAIHGRA